MAVGTGPDGAAIGLRRDAQHLLQRFVGPRLALPAGEIGEPGERHAVVEAELDETALDLVIAGLRLGHDAVDGGLVEDLADGRRLHQDYVVTLGHSASSPAAAACADPTGRGFV